MGCLLLVGTAAVVLFIQSLSGASGEPEPPYTSYRVADYPYNYYTYYRNPLYFRKYTPAISPYEGLVYKTDRYGNTYATASSRASYGRSYDTTPSNTINTLSMTYVKSCSGNTCGQNAQCSIIGGRPVCSCFRGYLGDPLVQCIRAECLDNSECRGHQTCRSGRCINVCEGTCGTNANCDARQHLPVCSCPAGYTGDPFTHCRRFDPSELCHPSPCGANTNCEVVNERPTCKCLPGYHGSPLTGCRHECESDVECGYNLACIEFKCQNPCTQCGQLAECENVQSHRAVCKCPKGYIGDPYSACKPECYGDVDCPAGRPACFYGICKNPCDGVCGVNANCELRGLTPVCSCPRDMTGDPFISCRPFEARDLCEPNPCGANARCEPGHDRTGKERPVCTCHPGYIGDPLTGCIRGECTEDAHCPDNRACIDYSCQNPCVGQCGVNAECSPRRHIAVCTCATGYNGDALNNCRPITP